MDKNNGKSLLALLGGILLMSFPLDAHAQWPTLDIVAIKTAITSNLELVKQSKVVTDATALAGKINSGIGDAKASMSKFAGDNLEKAKEKMKKLEKEKERLDGMKKKYDDAKEFAEKRKAELEEAKAFAAEQKARVAEAKAFAEEKKGEFNDYKDQAEGLKNDVSSGINDAKGMAGDLKDVAEAKKNELKGQAGLAENLEAAPEPEYELPEITSDDKMYEETEAPLDEALSDEEKAEIKEQEIAEAEEERDAALAYLEQVKAEGGDVAEAEAMLAAAESKLGKSYEDQARETASSGTGVNADAMMQDEYEKAAREAGSAGVSSDFKAEGKAAVAAEMGAVMTEGASELKAEKVQGRKAFGNMDKAAKKEAKAVAKLETKALSKQAAPATMKADMKATPAAMKSSPAAMRATPTAKQEMKATGRKAFQKNSELNLEQTNKYVSRSFNEKMSFAQLGGGMIDNTIKGKLIGPASFFDYCGFSASDTTDKNVRDCLLKLINAANSENQQDAAAAQAMIMEILGEKNISFAAVGLKATKDIAGNDEKQDKLNVSAGQASQGRDDTSALTMNNKETQVLANGLMDVYSAKLLLDGLDKLNSIKAESVTEEPVTTEAKMVDDTFDGKKTVAPAMYELCEFNAKDVTETNKIVYDCMEKLIETKSNPDMKIAEEGNRNFAVITSNTALDKINEGFEALKDVAKNDSKVEKMEEDSGDAKNARMDHTALAATNLQIQLKLNKVIDVYTSQMLMDSLNYMRSVDISAFPGKSGGENG